MKKVLALLLAIIFVLSMAGCGIGSDASDDTGTLTIKTELSMQKRWGVIFEHYYTAKGRLVKTDIRDTAYYCGIVLNKCKYIYEDNELSAVEVYEVAEIDAENYDVGKYTREEKLCNKVEFSKNSDGSLIGKIYDFDDYGQKIETDETVTVIYSKDKVSNVQYGGLSMEYDENGKKLSETDGENRAEFTYSGDFATEMKVYEGDTLSEAYTAEYDENGYVKAYTVTDAEDGDKTELTFEIDSASGSLNKFSSEETSITIEYTDKGYIKYLLVDGEDYLIYNITYDENSRVVKVIEEQDMSVDGVIEDKEERTYSYNPEGKVAECIFVGYSINDSDVFEKSSESKTTYSYDSAGRLIEEKKHDSDNGYTKTYSYDSNGRLLSYEKTEMYSNDYIRNDKEEYEYHENGQKKKDIRINGENKRVLEYDDKGRKVKSYSIDKNGSVIEGDYTTYTNIIEYKYGSVKRWTTEEISYSNDIPDRKRNEVYEYGWVDKSLSVEEYKYENGKWETTYQWSAEEN